MSSPDIAQNIQLNWKVGLIDAQKEEINSTYYLLINSRQKSELPLNRLNYGP